MSLRAALAAVAMLATATSFHYERPVQFASDAAPKTCVVLPVEVMAHAAPELRDLRLMAGEHEVAYQLQVSGETGAEQAKPEQILNLGERDGAVSFDAAMTEPRYSRVRLRMGRAHFSVLVRVTGVEHPGERGVAFPEIAWSSDAQEATEQQRIITLPESSFRYLHFELKTLALEPVTPQDIAGVEVWPEGPQPPRYMRAAMAPPPEQRRHQTVYTFAVPANVPVEKVRFTSDDPQDVFLREATLARAASASGERMPEHSESISIGQSKPSAAASEGEGTTVDFPAVPVASAVTLTIENGDDAPLALRSVALDMRERRVCFLRKPGVSYVLAYGNASLSAPQYDLSPIEAVADPSMSTLGAERILDGAETLRPFTERHPMLLWAALILVVGTLGFVALRSAKSHASDNNRE